MYCPPVVPEQVALQPRRAVGFLQPLTRRHRLEYFVATVRAAGLVDVNGAVVFIAADSILLGQVHMHPGRCHELMAEAGLLVGIFAQLHLVERHD